MAEYTLAGSLLTSIQALKAAPPFIKLGLVKLLRVRKKRLKD
jgi:hypothetical protein